MNKTQKRVVEIALLLMAVSILIPPINTYISEFSEYGPIYSMEFGWDFIWTVGQGKKVRFDILILEWVGLIALGGSLFILFKKNK